MFIYHCFGGTHSSVVAASLHVGIISDNKLPSNQEIINLPHFDKLTSEDHGKIFFIGKDEKGNSIYTMGCRNKSKLVIKVLTEAARIYNININKVKFVNTLPYVNWYMRLGGYLSRSWGLTFLGRPLVLLGVKKAFPGFANLVSDIKKEYEVKL